MLDQYCDSLYRPGAEGNLEIHQRKGNPIKVLQGKRKNGIRHVYYELARSRIRNKEHLPRDFLSILKSHRYFEKLDALIHHEPFERMSLTDRIEANEIEAEVDHIWNQAIKTSVFLRMSGRYPNHFKTPSDLKPPEVAHSERMERRILLSEISRAIWRDHPNWKKVTRTFEALRLQYLKVIDRLPLKEKTRRDWKERISSIALVLPGSLPEITDQECSSTNSNAFYYSYQNVITVCAGDFNSEDILSTLSHEMAHALDHDRDLFLYFKNSDFIKRLMRIGDPFCTTQKKSIPCEDWAGFKSDSMELTRSLGQFTPVLPDLNRCLQKEEARQPLDEKAIDRFAGAASREKIRGLADEEAFIRLIAPKLPLANGKKVANPSYMNPCHYLQSSWQIEEVNGELPILTAFLAEYQCSPEKDSSERLAKALSFTNALFKEVEAGMIRSEGEFSARRSLMEEDYSSPPNERFADYMGALVTAEYLKEIQATWDRRAVFLAGNSWQCSGPSLSTAFPDEAEVLRRYVVDSHTDGDERKMDQFPEPIRSVLSCEQDFETKECSFSAFPEKP
ncbi:MAG: hypothetical protein EBX52_12120 [Proteobacteria bacterium]|nr:hypothetical protein [Pseudomonadota bacterium]